MAAPVHYDLDATFPPKIDEAALLAIVGRANRALASYGGMLASLPSSELLLSSLTSSEAVSSSRIEGTRITLSEFLEIQAENGKGKFSAEQTDDSEEVGNYCRALTESALALADRRLSLNLLCRAHQILMEGVRGRDKNPGKLRMRQNWIGRPGATIEQATYVPVACEHLQIRLERWEKYLNRESDDLDPLIQLAVIHAEFEALHPFEDGNGRLGRMIIPLVLYQRRIPPKPHFYMSAYLDSNRDQYMEALLLISKERAWTEWCRFFLEGIIQQVSENQRKVEKIRKLQEAAIAELRKRVRSPYIHEFVNFVFAHPIFLGIQVPAELNIAKATAWRLVNNLCDAGLLKGLKKGTDGKTEIFVFPQLLNIVEGGDL